MGVARTLSVRLMRAEDAVAVAGLTSELGYPSSETDIARRITLINRHRDAGLFVAEEPDGGVIGWIHAQALYLLESNPRAEIWGLVVAPSERGTGVGRLLVEAAESWATERGFTVMGLRSNVLRLDARPFYEHLGYSVVKTQNAFRKDL